MKEDSMLSFDHHTRARSGLWGGRRINRPVQPLCQWGQTLGRVAANLIGLALTVVLGFCVLPARAQSTPAPVRILVGAPAGGTTDTMARALAQALPPLSSAGIASWQRPT